MENQKDVLDLSKYTTEALIADLPANRQFERTDGKWRIVREEVQNGYMLREVIAEQKQDESFRDFLCRYLQDAYDCGYNGAFLREYKKDTHITLNIGKLVEKMEVQHSVNPIKVSDEMQAILTKAIENSVVNAQENL